MTTAHPLSCPYCPQVDGGKPLRFDASARVHRCPCCGSEWVVSLSPARPRWKPTVTASCHGLVLKIDRALHAR